MSGSRALVTETVRQADAEGPPLGLPGSPGHRLRRLITAMVEARRAQPELFLLMQHVVSDPATPRDLLDLILARGRAVCGRSPPRSARLRSWCSAGTGTNTAGPAPPPCRSAPGEERSASGRDRTRGSFGQL